MIDRLCLLLDRPLEPVVARAVVVCASAAMLGLAALLALSLGEQNRSRSGGATEPVSAFRPGTASPSLAGGQREPGEPGPPSPRQDPQDTEGSSAARRAARALRSHRALQHVPYRGEGIAIDLAGASGDRAMLRVDAATLAAARQGWRRFLRRYRDPGRAYRAIFRAKRGRDG